MVKDKKFDFLLFSICLLGIDLIFKALVLLTEKFLLWTVPTLLVRIYSCGVYLIFAISLGVDIYKLKMEKIKVYTNEYIKGGKNGR